MCNLDELLIDITDFDCIKDIADHCTIDSLCQYIREAQDIHLSNKIGWGLLDLLINAVEVDTTYNDLLCGSVFQYCNKTEKHFGLKRVLVHYAYAIKVRNSNYHDTSTGTVYKQTRDSVPVDEDILERLKIEHYNLANEYWKMTEKYLCANAELFPDFNDCNCKCECDDCDNKTTLGNSRFRKSTTFRKYGNNSNNKYGNDNLHDGCGCDSCR